MKRSNNIEASGGERMLSEAGILQFLPEKIKKKYSPCIEIWDTIGSTNDRAALIARERTNVDENTPLYIIVARSQTSGRGTRDRSFYSPADSGIYMSLLFFPEFSRERRPLITIAAAVAVCTAIDRIDRERGVAPRSAVKWVNDVIVDGKKACGILTEGSFSDGVLKNFTVGIGINVTAPEGGFPRDIASVAGAVFDTAPSYDKIISYITEAFLALIESDDRGGLIESYKKRCITVGGTVSLYRGGEYVTASVTDITEDGFLSVTLPSGETCIVNSTAELL